MFIITGGILGSVLRFVVKGIKISNYNGDFPINTLCINIIGSFLLAMILTIALKAKKTDEDFQVGITVGFLGAFTTFSGFAKETEGMLAIGHVFCAGLYVFLSIILGMVAAYSGVNITKKFTH
jgi:fluoride exporter